MNKEKLMITAIISLALTLAISAENLILSLDAGGRASLTDPLSGKTTKDSFMPFVIENGKTKKEIVPGKPASVKTVARKTLCRYENLDGFLNLELEIVPQSSHTVLKYTLENNGAEQAWLKIQQVLPWLGEEPVSYWDGFAPYPQVTGPIIRKDKMGAFPMSCLFTKNSGLAIALDGNQIFSYMESEVRAGNPKQMAHGVKVVIDPKKKETVTFLVYAFNSDYGHLNALQVYYDLFPLCFAPAQGIDPRIVERSETEYPYNFTVPPTEIIRRSCGGWRWNYAPFKIAGDWLAKPELWNKYPHEKGNCNESQQKHIDETFNNITCEQYHEQRVQRMKLDTDEACDAISMFYTISHCDHRLAKDRYPDAIVTDPATKNTYGPGWVHTGSTEHRMWWWENDFARDTMQDLSKIKDSLNIGGFAIDCAGSSGGKGAKCRNNGIERSPGRAYDDEGVYCDEGVAVAKMADYMHSLKKGNRTMGVAMNASAGQWYMLFRGDVTLAEGKVTHALTNTRDFEAARYLMGKKPRIFYCILFYHDTIGMEIDWQQFSAAEVRKIYRNLWNAALLFSYRFALYPATDMAFGSERMMKHLPKMAKIIPAGWEPVSAIRPGKDLWTARYGKDLNSYLFVGNQTVDPQDFTASIDNEYLGQGSYVFCTFEGEPLDNQVVDGKTKIKHTLAPMDPLLLKAEARIQGITVFTAKVSETDELNQGTVNLSLQGSGNAEIALRLPPKTHGTQLTVNGAPVKFDAQTGTVSFKTALKGSNAIILTWQSDVFQVAKKDLLAFPFTDGQKPTCTLLLPEPADKQDEYAALRLQNYFRTYYGEVQKVKDLVIPIKKQAEQGEVTGALIRLEKGDQPSIALDTGKNLLTLRAPTAAERFELANKLMGVLDEKYIYYGTIGGGCTYPGNDDTKAMREKAGFGKGKIMWEKDDDHFPDTDKEKSAPGDKKTKSPEAFNTRPPNAKAFEPDSNTLFLCHYDQTLAANFANGPAAPQGGAGLTSNQGGYTGEALEVKPGMCVPPGGAYAPCTPVVYDALNNFNSLQGTMEMWVKVLKFPKDREKWTNCGLAGLTQWKSGGAERQIQLKIVTNNNQQWLYCWEYKDSFKKLFQLYHPIDDWEENQWHHVAVTWDKANRALFVDGAQVKAGATTVGDERFIPTVEEISIGGTSKVEKPAFQVLIDEVRISDVVRYVS